MKLKSLAAAAVLALTVGHSQAQTSFYDLGLVSGGLLLGETFASRSGSFNDLYNFSVAAPSSFAGVALALNLDIPFLPGVEYHIRDFGISLTDGNGLRVADFDGRDGFSLAAVIGTGTNYTFSVSGFVDGSWGGGYAAAMNVSPVVSPIPEPSTYALMLAGLGMVGFMTSRRRRVED